MSQDIYCDLLVEGHIVLITFTLIFTDICICTVHIHTGTYTDTYTYTYKYVYVNYVYIYIYMCVCVYIHTYIHTYIYIYIYIHIPVGSFAFHRHFVSKKGKRIPGVQEGYEPKPHLGYFVLAMERAASEPPVGKGLHAGINPFHSEKVQGEYMLAANRPRDLPELSPGSDALPLRNDIQIGKGRGGQSSGRVACFVTPPSKPSGRGGGDDAGLGVKQTEGRMPDEHEVNEVKDRNMDGLKQQHESEIPSSESLQRALELEIVQQLREQNALLLAEVERYRQLKGSAASGDSSVQSWVEILGDSGREGQDVENRNGMGCKTPRSRVSFGQTVRHTPNGTRVPDGTPPSEERPEPPPSQHVPVVPPFPTVVSEDPVKLLNNYEPVHETSTMRAMGTIWKPVCERSKEPSPSEARTFWLEKEVESLRGTLASFANGNSFQNSDYWNGRFQRDVNGDRSQSSMGPGPHVQLGRGDMPVDHNLGDPPFHSLGGSGVQLEQGRARMVSSGNRKEYPEHLLGGCGLQPLQARAPQQSTHGDCHDARAWQGNHGLCPDGRALHSSSGLCPDGRALQGNHGLYPDGRALQGDHGLCQDGRAPSMVQHHPSVCHDDRASDAACPHHQGPHRSCQDLRPHGGGGFGGGVDSIPGVMGIRRNRQLNQSRPPGVAMHCKSSAVWRLDPSLRTGHARSVLCGEQVVGFDSQTGADPLR